MWAYLEIAHTTQVPGIREYLLFAIEADPNVQLIIIKRRATYIFWNTVPAVCSAFYNCKIMSLDQKNVIAEHL